MAIMSRAKIIIIKKMNAAQFAFVHSAESDMFCGE